MIQQLKGLRWQERGHSNRLQSLNFCDENLLVSGGWDRNVNGFGFVGQFVGSATRKISPNNIQWKDCGGGIGLQGQSYSGRKLGWKS